MIDHTPAELRDLIYFDFNKAASIISQAEGGLLKEMTEAWEEIQGRQKSGGFDAKIAKAQLGSDAQEKASTLESRVLHHDLLNRLEKWLRVQHQLRDLNVFEGQPLDFSNEGIRKLIADPSFVVAEGSARIQDFGKLGRSASKLNDLVRFFNVPKIEAFKNSVEYQEMQKQLGDMKETIRKINVKANKEEANKKLKELELTIEKSLDPTQGGIPEWQLNGIQLILDTFLQGKIYLNIYPFLQNPDFSIIANLKRDCFIDAEVENVLFAYSTRPNVLLTVFGLVTALPPEDAHSLVPDQGVSDVPDKARAFEKSMDDTFQAWETLETNTRYSYYPNITVYPIAVYQRLGTLGIGEEHANVSGLSQF